MFLFHSMNALRMLCGCVFVSSTSFFSIQLSCDSLTMVFFFILLCVVAFIWCIMSLCLVESYGWVFFSHGFLSALRMLPQCFCFISQMLRMFLLFCFYFIDFIFQLFLCIVFTFFLTFIVQFSSNGTSLSFFHCSTFCTTK